MKQEEQAPVILVTHKSITEGCKGALLPVRTTEDWICIVPLLIFIVIIAISVLIPASRTGLIFTALMICGRVKDEIFIISKGPVKNSFFCYICTGKKRFVQAIDACDTLAIWLNNLYSLPC